LHKPKKRNTSAKAAKGFINKDFFISIYISII